MTGQVSGLFGSCVSLLCIYVVSYEHTRPTRLLWHLVLVRVICWGAWVFIFCQLIRLHGTMFLVVQHDRCS